MYIPKTNLMTDKGEILAFMKQFSFATVITASQGIPIATHLPFIVATHEENIILSSHFARANEHWRNIETAEVLVIFSEPHAYISTKKYDREVNVPTWNYISIHAYGRGRLITDAAETLAALEKTIDSYEPEYRKQWDNFPPEYKSKMSKGIVAFEIEVTDLQAKKKLSQNRTLTERGKIVDTLSNSNQPNDQLIAKFMRADLKHN
ncbi:MAG: FMN-binding negative transcriptional regulator [Pedobacter sp.]|nr:MAG: FMN-binding negative transcriptional regulator [Pedobacter sp.]